MRDPSLGLSDEQLATALAVVTAMPGVERARIAEDHLVVTPKEGYAIPTHVLGVRCEQDET